MKEPQGSHTSFPSTEPERRGVSVLQGILPDQHVSNFVCPHDMSVCQSCGLQVVLGTRCNLCEEVVEQCLFCETSAQRSHSSSACSIKFGDCTSNAVYDRGRASRTTFGIGGDSTSVLDRSSDQGQDCCSEGRAPGSSTRCHGGGDESAQEGCSEEVRSSDAVGQGKRDLQPVGHHQHHVQSHGESHPGEVRTTGHRDGGVWSSCRADLQGVDGDELPVPTLVRDHSGGRPGQLANAEACQMVQDPEDQGQQAGLPKTTTCDFYTQEDCYGKSVPCFRLRTQRLLRDQPSGRDLPSSGRIGQGQTGESGASGGEYRDVSNSGSHQDSQGDVSSESAVEALVEQTIFSKETCHWIKGCSGSQDVDSKAWKHLVHKHRLILMEVACSPDSLLSQEVDRVYGDGSSQRCSIWNGYDLTTVEGVAACKRLIDAERPCHIWISCECGPFSPLQRINQRSPEQISQLQSKRKNAIAQYLGGIEVAKYGRSKGSDIHFELSEKCEVWKLPEIMEFVEAQSLTKTTCNGCAVGLRSKDGSSLLCKGWTVATSSKHVAQHLHLPCQKNHKHALCEGGEAHRTTFYTPVFGKKVVESFGFVDDWNQIAHEIYYGNSEMVNTLFQTKDVDGFSGEEFSGVAITAEEKHAILRNIRHIHSVTGHCSMKYLLDSLKRRGVPNKVLEVAKTFSCPTCAEMKKPDCRLPASLELIHEKWKVCQTDIADWTHPETGQKMKFILFIDEGSRYRSGCVLPEKNATFPILKKCFEQHWLQHHGKPEVLRIDPNGAWRSKTAQAFLEQEGIEFGEIPAEAHWKIGLVEVAIRIMKDILTALAREFPDRSVEELFSKAIWASNSRAVYNGFSPLQHATGRSPDEWGRLHQSQVHGFPIVAQQYADGGFEHMQKMMLIAEKAFLDAQAKQRILRAQQAGFRRQCFYSPGDLVYYWRLTVAGSDGPQPFRKGKFVGPARVLAVETKQTEEGVEPGDVVWLHRNGRLLRATPSQLRPASSREIAYEELKGPLQVPWNLTNITHQPSKHLYEDISANFPSPEEFERTIEEDVPMTRHRTKRPPSRDKKLEEPIEKKRQSEDTVDSDLSAFWAMEDSAVAISVDAPDSHRKWKHFARDPAAYVAAQLRKKQCEVREKTLTSDELEQFKVAKQKEVSNFIQEKCLEVLPPNLQPPRHVAMRMRWLLNWKLADDGTRKAKARIVIQGYQDPLYEYRDTSAPVVSRTGRQCFLQMCAIQKFRTSKGDVTGAFLQGDVCQQDLWCLPTEELCTALAIPVHSVCKLRKAAYGLVQAPLMWYNSVCNFLASIGFHRLRSDP